MQRSLALDWQMQPAGGGHHYNEGEENEDKKRRVHITLDDDGTKLANNALLSAVCMRQ